MNKLMHFIENKLSPIVLKFAGNRYLNAVRDSFDFINPFLIAASLIFLALNLPIGNKDSFLYIESYANFVNSLKMDLIQPFYITFGIISIFISYGIGFSLSNYYKLNPNVGGFLSLFSFLLVAAKITYIPVTEEASKFLLAEKNTLIPVMDIRFINAKGLFIAIIFSIISIEIFRLLVNKKLTIKLPESVPPAIAKSFELLVPIIIITILFQSINIIIQKKLLLLIPNIIMKISEPLFNISNSLIFVIAILLVVHILWFAGLHGTNILGPIISIFTLHNIYINQTMLLNNEISNKIFAGGFIDLYILIGGVGTSLGLVFSMLISKNDHIKSIGKISLIPAIFNINESVMFGTPVIMNKYLMIPFLFIPIINASIAWVLIKLNIVGTIVAITPWTVPSPLGALITTNFNIYSMLLSIALLFTSCILYTPFLKAYEKTLEKDKK